jgi:hypothetical protein
MRRGTHIWKEYPKVIIDPFKYLVSDHPARKEKAATGLWGMLTMMMARSSESSLTMELTVEYRIGLAQPETPNRYQAKNLFRGQ